MRFKKLEQEGKKIFVVSSIGGLNTDIVPHFFKHYENIGIDGFIILFHVHPQNQEFLDTIADLKEQYNIIDSDVWQGGQERHIIFDRELNEEGRLNGALK